ncbi:MAG: tRNA pseudouridine(55) synthase TruB [Desulfosalsimonadaceae bacterium]|nr:tRNA pseudouridine(55) synthase TruB [Desulfosalsimonadaceae bacterium]
MIRETSGILIVDKPPQLSSAQFISRIKRISGINKIGHSGTLDPMATGVMICAVNQATRLFQFFLNRPKKYVAVVKLGIETDTLDATGTIVATRPFGMVSGESVRDACRQFEGEIDQIPPAYSALKHKGTPLYTYARRGTPVIKPSRKILISGIHILGINLPEVRIEVECSSGTYIRTLCADIGAVLGCGGHLSALQRIECGGYNIRDALSLEDIASHRSLEALAGRLISMSDALPEMPAAMADTGLVEKIRHGKVLSAIDIPADAQTEATPSTGDEGFPPVKIIDQDHRLLAVVRRDENKDRYNYCCVFCNP